MPLLQVEGLTRRFGGLTAVRGLDFEQEEGEILGIIGPNGAGKTTVFNLLTGFLRPDRGWIRFAGSSIVGLPPHAICQRGLVRTFQNLKPFARLTVFENVLVAALARTPDRRAATRAARELLAEVSLDEVAGRLPPELPIGHLKRLEVARALATRPRLLLLDEPFAGLNPAEVAELTHILLQVRRRGVSLCLIEHVMQAVMTLCDRIVVLHHGEKIAEGAPAAIASDPVVVRAYLGEAYAGSTGR